MTCCDEDRGAIELQEGQSGVFTFILKDENGDPVEKAAVDTLTLHIYDRLTDEIINTRDEQDVLDANGVTMHATSGLVTWSIAPVDVPFLGGDTIPAEVHIARFRATWDSGAKAFSYEIEMTVCNLKQFTVIEES